ncbi:hypothetical protein [Mycolicibacterium goodii]|uniref:Uncharacterized protein n=1 Tax=Mycolicibacterium goodii TaxID=134601 RepID=A0A0K0X3E1_MYCGD|nr:hypothetical protein AFA91_08695 [Mycolicibacterium goodii]
MHRDTVWEHKGVRIILLDSISQIEDSDRGAIVVAGSNGGRESGHVGVAAGCALVILNDAGIGKDRAGVAGLELLDQQHIPGATVSHMSAEISSGHDTWINGVVSVTNTRAAQLGIKPGDRVKEAVTALAERFAASAPTLEGNR